MGEPGDSEQKRSRFRDIGPTWISAIAALMTALLGAGFLLGHGSTPPTTGPSAENSIVAPPDGWNLPTSEHSSSSVPPSRSEPIAGTFLTTCHTSVSPGYGISIDQNCSAPTKSASDVFVTGVANPFGERMTPGLSHDPGSTLALLERGGGVTYESCSRATEYGDAYLAERDGSTVCYHGHGLTAAITVTATSSSATLDYTVWTG